MQEQAKKHILRSFAKNYKLIWTFYGKSVPRERNDHRKARLCEDMLALKAFAKFSSFFVSDDKDA